MRKLVTVAALSVSAASDLSVSWEDCGDASYHAHTSSLSPTRLTLGETTTVTAQGSGDESVQSGTFHVKMTAGGLTLVNTDGDICSAKKINLPFGTGHIAFKGLECPVNAGDLALAMDVYLSSLIPSYLQTAQIQITAQTGSDKLICLNLNTKPEAKQSAVGDVNNLGSSGACSADDKQKINSQPAGSADGSFPKTTSDCGKGALSIWSGINKDTFNQCLQGRYQISESCSTCYYNAAEYGFHNCKSACLFSWCSSSCLNCAKGYDTVGCAGFDGPEPTACDSSSVNV